MSLPNALTILRLILAVAIIVLLTVWRYPSADTVSTSVSSTTRAMLLLVAVLFTLGALTDALDGILARRWNIVSRFGRIMDPFADKLLVVGTLAVLAGPAFAVQLPDDRSLQVSGVLPWMVIVIASREVLVTLSRAVFEAQGVDFSASFSGKAKMFVQSVSVPVILVTLALAPAAPGTPARTLIDVVAWTCVLVTTASIIPYARRSLQLATADRTGALHGPQAARPSEHSRSSNPHQR